MVSKYLKLDSTQPVCHEKMLKEKSSREFGHLVLFQMQKNIHSINVGHKYTNTCLVTV